MTTTNTDEIDLTRIMNGRGAEWWHALSDAEKELVRDFNQEPARQRARRARARGIVSKAVKEGRLQRKPCEVCGSLAVEGHHEDYDKPLDVMWLCAPHHRKRHLTHPVKSLGRAAREAWIARMAGGHGRAA